MHAKGQAEGTGVTVADEPKKDEAEESKTSEEPEEPAKTSERPEAPTEPEATANASEGEASATESASEEDDEDEDDDGASPAAIARRVASLDAEDETERLARLEEEKLAERRRKARQGKGKKKGGLETAASKRLAKIGSKAPPAKRSVATAVDADPLIEKTAEFSKWIKKNQKVVAIVAAAAVVGGLVFGGYSLMQRKRGHEASAALAAAVADQRGRVGDPDREDDDPDRPKDPTPLFRTAEERREAALTKYREVQGKYPGTGAAYLSRLGEASLLLDKQDAEGARAAYEDVVGSPLATADGEVRGRALEGLGFALELKAQAAAEGADKEKLQDDAIKKFRELENTDVFGFKELGMYHQARVYEAKGDKERAKELLKALYERATKPGEGHPFPMLEQLAEDRLRALDPSALPPKTMNPFAGMGPGGQMTEAQRKMLQEMMLRQMQQQQGGGGVPLP